MYPEYCETLEEAEKFSDLIAVEHGFTLTKILLKTLRRICRIYENGKYRLIIEAFFSNEHGYVVSPSWCWTFAADIFLKDAKRKGDHSYIRTKRGHPTLESWEKKPSYFAGEVRGMICDLELIDSNSRVTGRIAYKHPGNSFSAEIDWRWSRWLRVIHIDIDDIPPNKRHIIDIGSELKFRIVDDIKGPRAADIEVL